MLTIEQAQADLGTLMAEEKAQWLFDLAKGLRVEVEHYRHANEQTEEVFNQFDVAMGRAEAWLRGERIDASTLLYPVYNDDGTDIADSTLPELMPARDVELVGSTITTMGVYTALLQFVREGVERLPHPYQGNDITDWELTEWLVDGDRESYSPKLREKFDALWNARFGRAE